MAASAAPRLPASAATDPPPGAGELLGHFVDEALDRHGRERCRHAHSVLDDPPVRVERRELRETQRLDGDFHELALRKAWRATLLLQVIAAGFHQRFEWRQSDELGARHHESQLDRLFAHGLEDHVQRRRAIREEVDRHLRLAILLDVPADRFRGLEPPRHAQVLARRILDDLAHRVALQASRFAMLSATSFASFGSRVLRLTL
jgi:hypothetical protein